MTRLHNRFGHDQGRLPLNGDCQDLLARANVQGMLDRTEVWFVRVRVGVREVDPTGTMLLPGRKGCLGCL